MTPTDEVNTCEHGISLMEYCDFCDGGIEPLHFPKPPPQSLELEKRFKEIAASYYGYLANEDSPKDLWNSMLEQMVKEASALHNADIEYVIGENIRVMSHSNKDFIDGMNNQKEVSRQRWEERHG